MRQITKQAEPNELVQYRNVPGATYDGGNFTPVKAAIRVALLRDQGHLCAYCMRRIKEESMKVEHWESQTDFLDRQLSWDNLLGVCHGNEGQPWTQQTCDTRRGNLPLTYNPANPAHQIESRIQYLGNGKITSAETAFAQELDQVLNLNWSRLLENRKAVFDAVKQLLNSKPNARTKAEVVRYITRWQELENGKLKEYCAVAVYFLQKKLRQFN